MFRFLSLYMRDLMSREDGQDLVEYALIVALIAFGAVAGMNTLSTQVSSAFNTLASDLRSALGQSGGGGGVIGI